MSVFIIFAFLFFCGSLLGWVLELFFRRFFSKANPERKWINPGFCVGPYIPLYGFGLCILYAIGALETYIGIQNPVLSKALMILIILVALTLIEYLAGLICLKLFKVRLWDYSQEKWNIQGLICPKFSVFWALLGAAYLFLVHHYVLDALGWLSENLTFTFVVGFFYGVFIVDVAYSSHLIAKIKQYAKENDIVVKWEHLKAEIKEKAENLGKKTNFLFPLHLHNLITERRERNKDEREDGKEEVSAEGSADVTAKDVTE